MKKYLFRLIIFLSMPCLASTVKSNTTFEVLESHVLDWKNDNSSYEIVLGYYKGDFENAELRIFHDKNIVFETRKLGCVSEFREATWCKYFLNNTQLNLLRSEKLIMLPQFKDNSKYPLLFIFGCPVASDPGGFQIIALSDDGIPAEILQLGAFEVIDFVDLNNDGIPEIIGKQCLSQYGGQNLDFVTYDPFSVYKFGKKSSSQMMLSMSLSKKYNKENYYGWAGIHCREDITIFLHPPGGGKPVIMKTEDALKLPEAKWH